MPPRRSPLGALLHRERLQPKRPRGSEHRREQAPGPRPPKPTTPTTLTLTLTRSSAADPHPNPNPSPSPNVPLTLTPTRSSASPWTRRRRLPPGGVSAEGPHCHSEVPPPTPSLPCRLRMRHSTRVVMGLHESDPLTVQVVQCSPSRLVIDHLSEICVRVPVRSGHTRRDSTVSGATRVVSRDRSRAPRRRDPTPESRDARDEREFVPRVLPRESEQRDIR